MSTKQISLGDEVIVTSPDAGVDLHTIGYVASPVMGSLVLVDFESACLEVRISDIQLYTDFCKEPKDV